MVQFVSKIISQIGRSLIVEIVFKRGKKIKVRQSVQLGCHMKGICLDISKHGLPLL